MGINIPIALVIGEDENYIRFFGLKQRMKAEREKEEREVFFHKTILLFIFEEMLGNGKKTFGEQF
jgi:hypothetical protein